MTHWGALESAKLYAASVRRVLPRSSRLGRDERLVFVVGSPRSGTTFLAGAIGSLPGFVDLGEVAPLKAAIPELQRLPERVAAVRLRRVLDRVRRFGLVTGLRAVEQTPEVAFLLEAALAAYPEARVVHALRDGRDVVCSLLERGWLGAEREGRDDAGLHFGPRARFWVEPGREEEFERASDAARAAWAWRTYASAALAVSERVLEVRYEAFANDRAAVADQLGRHLGVPAERVTTALGDAHAESVGRWRRDLTPEQLADVEREAGPLLRRLGYD